MVLIEICPEAISIHRHVVGCIRTNALSRWIYCTSKNNQIYTFESNSRSKARLNISGTLWCFVQTANLCSLTLRPPIHQGNHYKGSDAGIKCCLKGKTRGNKSSLAAVCLWLASDGGVWNGWLASLSCAHTITEHQITLLNFTQSWKFISTRIRWHRYNAENKAAEAAGCCRSMPLRHCYLNRCRELNPPNEEAIVSSVFYAWESQI